MCQYCNVEANYKPSPREHLQPPRLFFFCRNCGQEVQGVVKNGEVREIKNRCRKTEPRTRHVTLRLTERERRRFDASGKTARNVFLAGLDAPDNV